MRKFAILIFAIFLSQVSSAAIWNIRIAGHDIQLTGDIAKEKNHITLKNIVATEVRSGSTYKIGYFLQDTLIDKHLINSIQFQFPLEVCNQLAQEWGFKHNSAGSMYTPIELQNSSDLLIITNRGSILDITFEKFSSLVYERSLSEISCELVN